MLRNVILFAISAMFLGLGLGRFAFSPLMPELVGGGWLDAGAVQAVGAANLVGYLVGALLAKPLLRIIDERRLCPLSGLMVFLSYALLIVPCGTGWFWGMRFLAGVGGGWLMVVATAAAARQLVALGRQALQPLVFVGIGLGALFAALFLPKVLTFGIAPSLALLTLFSAVALVVLWRSSGFLSGQITPRVVADRAASRIGWSVILILLAYGCDALGFVMHTVYLPDMLRRTYGFSEGQVGLCWAMFGIGACFGPLFVLLLRRVLSVADALWIAFVIKAVGVSLVLFSAGPLAASLSLFIVGMLTPGIVILTSGALAAVAPAECYLALWAAGTALFALCQMLSGMFIAAISARGYAIALDLSVLVLAAGGIFALLSRMRLIGQMAR